MDLLKEPVVVMDFYKGLNPLKQVKSFGQAYQCMDRLTDTLVLIP